jgi:hypothetical protein
MNFFQKNKFLFKTSFFVSSFFPAIGNLFYVLMSSEKTKDYIFSYNVGSSTIGFLCILMIPILFTRFNIIKTVKIFVLFYTFFTIISYALFGIFTTVILCIIMITISFEYFASRSSRFKEIFLFRISILFTGLSVVLLDDMTSLIIRLFILLIISIYTYFKILHENKIQSDNLSLKKLEYFVVMIVNVVWAYILPLFLIQQSSSSHSKVIYVVATLLPMMFFKIQDMIIKIDFLSINQKNYSNIIIIKKSAYFVVISYIFFAASYYYFYNKIDINFVIFFMLSIFSVLSNVFLMNRILCIEKNTAFSKISP